MLCQKSFILILIGLAVVYLASNKMREGFSVYAIDDGSSYVPSYEACRDMGHTREFCVQAPYSAFWPGSCRCANGDVGQFLVGYRGKCVCGHGGYTLALN